ncbi:MAG: DMT family transporter [Candidatus Gastranaerophilaceae bacterium]
MAWVYLLIAGFFEIGWAVGLKMSEGFTRPIIGTFTAIGMIASYYFLAIALKNIPLGTAYAIWTGIGIVGTAIFGIIIFKEPVTAIRFICIAMILCGIIGLKTLSA